MPVELGPPPRDKSRRHAYDSLFATLTATAPGEWASLPLDEVGGKLIGDKQSSIHVAGANRGCRVQTTVQGERIYARIVETNPRSESSPISA
jgi:hypothetical protein